MGGYVNLFGKQHSKDILKCVSNQVNFSISYLSRHFKKKMGVTYTKYLQKQRIEQSLHLLLHTNKKVVEIAELRGYSDMKFFNSLYKKNIETAENFV